MKKVKVVMGTNDEDFEESLNLELHSLQADQAEIIDIKYAETEKTLSAIIIYEQ